MLATRNKRVESPQYFGAILAQLGFFTGSYALRRVSRGEWAYIPDRDTPLTFTRPNGMVIVVNHLFGTTDLGSVPRWLWSIPGMAPADMELSSIVHDFLFLAHRAGEITPDFRTVNEILYEGLLVEGYRPWMARGVRWACNTFGERLWKLPASVKVEDRPFLIGQATLTPDMESI